MTEIKVSTTLEEINNAPSLSAWESFCDKYGYSYWCMNEGQANSDDVVQISHDDAKNWGLIGETVQSHKYNVDIKNFVKKLFNKGGSIQKNKRNKRKRTLKK